VAAPAAASPDLSLSPVLSLSPAVSLKSGRAAVVTLTNAQRALFGCAPLTLKKRLTIAAQGHADDMAANGYFDHTSADGTSWSDRIRRTGWKKPGGENIAVGFGSAATVLTAWMNSPAHRHNILNCKFRSIGVGISSTGSYWVQDFGY
jgi:uncharacterized protein YkwD